MSGWSGWGVWRYALRLEEVIIDYFFSPNCDQLQLHILWYPSPNLRRLVLVSFIDTHFLERWLFKLEEYLLRISESNTTGIQRMLREEASANYWTLSPSELREWMEIWYVVVRDEAINFVTKTTFADCHPSAIHHHPL
jgi:hypothetical protein